MVENRPCERHIVTIGKRLAAASLRNHSPRRFVDVGLADIEMADCPHALRAFVEHSDADRIEPSAEFGRGAQRRINLEIDKVGLDRAKIARQTRNAIDGFGEATGIGMILSQSFDVMIERVQRRPREQAALPHRAAEHFAKAPGSRDGGGVSGQRAPDRAAEAF